MGRAGQRAAAGRGQHGEQTAGSGEHKAGTPVVHVCLERRNAAGSVGADGAGAVRERATAALGDGGRGGGVVGHFAVGHVRGQDDDPAGDAVDFEEGVPIFRRKVVPHVLDQGELAYGSGVRAEQVSAEVHAVLGGHVGAGPRIGRGVPEPVAVEAIAAHVPGGNDVEFAQGFAVGEELDGAVASEGGHLQGLDGIVEVGELVILAAQHGLLLGGEHGVELHAALAEPLFDGHGVPVHLAQHADAAFDETDHVGVALLYKGKAPLDIGPHAAQGFVEPGGDGGRGEVAERIELVAPAVGGGDAPLRVEAGDDGGFGGGLARAIGDLVRGDHRRASRSAGSFAEPLCISTEPLCRLERAPWGHPGQGSPLKARHGARSEGGMQAKSVMRRQGSGCGVRRARASGWCAAGWGPWRRRRRCWRARPVQGRCSGPRGRRRCEAHRR